MGSMRKELFLSIFARQRSSGLSVKDFCVNEGYSLSNFNYWKSKFGLTCGDKRSKELSEDLAPVCFSSQPNPAGSLSNPVHSSDEIMISFPDGIQVHFRGTIHSESAMKLLSQIYRSHVLPE